MDRSTSITRFGRPAAIVIAALALLAVGLFLNRQDTLADHATTGLLPQPYNTALGSSTVECDPHGFEVDADIQVGTVPNGAAPRSQCPGDDWSTANGAATDSGSGQDAVFKLGTMAENIAVCGANANNPNSGAPRPVARTAAFPTSAFGCDDLALGNFTDCTTHTNGDKVDDGTYSIVDGGAQPKADIANFYSTILNTNPPTAVVGFERVTTSGDTHLNVAFKQGGAILGGSLCPAHAEMISSGWSIGDLIANVNYAGGTAQPTISVFKVEALLPPDNAADLCQATMGPLEVDNYCAGTPPNVLGLTNCNVVQQNNQLRCGDGDTDGSEIKAGFWLSHICNGTVDNPSGSQAGCRDSTTLSPSAPNRGHPETRLPQRSFIEVRLSSNLINPCFANLQVQSRASGESVTSALSDIGEAGFPGCKMRIEKRDADTNALIGGATFRIDPNPFRLPACGPDGTLDVADDTDGVPGPGPDSNPAPGIIELSPVCPGSYSVTEIVAPGGYAINPTPATCTITTSTCTAVITNPLGTLEWEKRDESTGGAGAHPLQGGATFRVSPHPYWCHSDTLMGNPTPGAAADGFLDVTDGNGNDFDADSGQLWLKRVCLGTYTVTETAAPSGYAIDDDADRVETVSDANNGVDDDGDTVVDDVEEFNAVIGTAVDSPPPPTQGAPPGTDDDGNTDESDFHNRRGSLLFLKQAKNKSVQGGLEAFCCATFTVTPDPTDGVGSLTVTDNGANDGDPAAGRICVDAVPLNTEFTIAETNSNNVNYAADSTTRTATLTTSSRCADRGADTPDVAQAFVNTPLSELEVIFRSLAGDGVTQITQPITCDSIADTDADSPGPTFDDPTLDRDEVFTGLPPGTYTCTIVIDP